ncbi:hypothetical protein ACFPPD_12225 [Cohnella suwonensis]|uniref:Uncharacterized protein n=1 Tax=Cohnella suwonensis TaxID=696072 RepID=A0ABW0LUD3_9BACL
MRVAEAWLDGQFEYSERHGIRIPRLTADWETLGPERQIAVLERWEIIRGSIPDRIFAFEAGIRIKQQQLFEEEDFARSCRINDDISDLASRINDLNIWFRVQQELDDGGKPHAG